MPQIYIAAVITFGVALMLWGGLVYLLSGHETRYFWLLLPGLPLSAIVNLVLKRQAIVFVGQAGHVPPGLGLASPIWFLVFLVLITPVIEEPLKALPLLLRPAWRTVTSRMSALWTGFALGISFGLGEAAFVAYSVTQIQEYASLPWYAFTGYLSERLFTCFAHGVMTSVLITGLHRGGRMIPYGFLGSMGLHLLLNTPAAMYQFKWISPELYSFSLLIPLLLLCVIFERQRRAASGAKENQAAHEVMYWQRTPSGGR